MTRNQSVSLDRATGRRVALLNANPPPGKRRRPKDLPAEAWATPAATRDSVHLNSTIVIRELRTKRRERYTLVPPQEADILENRISTLSPLGRALLGKSVGCTVKVHAPAGVFSVRIEQISSAPERRET